MLQGYSVRIHFIRWLGSVKMHVTYNIWNKLGQFSFKHDFIFSIKEKFLLKPIYWRFIKVELSVQRGGGGNGTLVPSYHPNISAQEALLENS